jgi:hypothetical protein
LGSHVGAIALYGSRVGKWRKLSRNLCPIKGSDLKDERKDVRQ